MFKIILHGVHVYNLFELMLWYGVFAVLLETELYEGTQVMDGM